MRISSFLKDLLLWKGMCIEHGELASALANNQILGSPIPTEHDLRPKVFTLLEVEKGKTTLHFPIMRLKV